jgi:uncharacterized protein YigA (DUF484 family)
VQTLKANPDLSRHIKDTEGSARTAETVKQDFSIFRAAIKSLPNECKTLMQLANLNDCTSTLLNEFSTLDMRCREIENLLVGVSGGYNRYLNLVRNSLAGHMRSSS